MDLLAYMSERASHWRNELMGPKVSWFGKRKMYETFVRGRDDVDQTTLTTIRADMPRTYPEVEAMKDATPTIRSLLISYAAVQRGDGYLQGFNYIMTILWFTFEKEPYAEADTWWCFTRVVGLIRPLMPDFNVTWFHWYRNHWFEEFHRKLKRRRPHIESIISRDTNTFSGLITVKWFMIWFAQNFSFEEIFILWDFIIAQPKQYLMQVYTLITYEIIYEAAPSVTYQWSNEPVGLLHKLLSIKVKNVAGLIENIEQSL